MDTVFKTYFCDHVPHICEVVVPVYLPEICIVRIMGKGDKQLKLDLWFRWVFTKRSTWTNDTYMNRQATMLSYYKKQRSARTQATLFRYGVIVRKGFDKQLSLKRYGFTKRRDVPDID